MKNTITIISIFSIGLGFGLVIYAYATPSYQEMSAEELHHSVITQRDFGIEKAIASGHFNCCIEPACTMCYMEGNMWNHQTAGTCDCVDSIRQGQDPCPQCKRMLEENRKVDCQEDTACEIK